MLVAASSLVLGAALLSAQTSTTLDDAATCAQAVADAGTDWTVLACWMRLAAREAPRAPDDSSSRASSTRASSADSPHTMPERELEALLDAPPPLDAGAAFYLAQVRERAGEKAAPLYERAARSFAAAGVYDGVYWSRLNLGRLARQAERWHRAVAELEGALAAATRVGDEGQVAGAELEMLRLRLRAGDDLRDIEGALVDLLERFEAETSATATRRAPLRERALAALGDVRFRLGRYADARATWRRLEALQEADGDAYGLATTAFNLSLEHLTRNALERDADPATAAEPALRRALELARAAGHRTIEAVAAGQLAELETWGSTESAAFFERALELADPDLMPIQRRGVLVGMASERAAADPDAARRHLDAARALAAGPTLVAGDAYLGEATLRVAWTSQPFDAALAESLAALDDLEALRARQLAHGGRGDYFAVWSQTPDLLAGLLFEAASRVPPPGRAIDLAALDAHEAPPRARARPILDRDAITHAFEVLERRRARLLLDTTVAAPTVDPVTTTTDSTATTDSTDSADADSADTGSSLPPHAQLERLSAEQAALHRRLLAPDLDERERAETEARLDRLEAREDAVWRRLESERLALGDDPPAAAAPVAGLADVRSALGTDEALVVVQTSPRRGVFGRFGGGSWLLVVTRDSEHLVELPSPRRLRLAVDTVSGLLEVGDPDPSAAVAALTELTVGPALAPLPASIEHLVVLADGPLHRLPLAALLTAPETAARPIGLRFAISRPPSATLWLRWRRGLDGDHDEPPRAAPPEAPALVFADPAFDPATTVAGRRLQRLPGAAAEASAVRRRLGRDTEGRLGERADEASLRRSDLDRFAVLHFAAHALLDSRNARRSGIVLAPSGTDDGLLRPPEIASLALHDRLVVLTACHGAAGRLLRAEGPQSLARAFFEAGARSVVAGLWRLRDDHAERFTDRFYAALADGASVADAARTARRDLADEGLPAAAWSGLVVLGDGAHVPFPHGTAGEPGSPSPLVRHRLRWILLGLALLVALGLASVRFRGRARADGTERGRT